jgi:CRP-like cAMP-binding protein
MSDLSRIEKVVILQSVDVFSQCKAEEVLRIASIAHERPFAEGEVLFSTGEPAEELHSLVRGSVRLETADGGERVSVGPLQTLGVLDILSGRLGTRTATATAAGVALAFGAEDLFDLLSNNIEIVKSLFRHVALGGGETNRGLM